MSIACAGCAGSSLTPGERILASDLIAAWRREDALTGGPGVGDRRAQLLQSILPNEIQFWRCPACGLEMADPPVTWPGSEYPRDQSYPVRWEFGRCVADLGETPLDVLELGCGTGEFLAAAAAKGHRVVGIDFNDAAVQTARGRGLKAICGGFDRLRTDEGTERGFDAAAMFQVIEHVADPDRLLTQLDSVLRQRARLFIACPGPRRFTTLILEQRAGASDFWDYPPHHVLRWTIPALRALLARHGWNVHAAIEEPFSWIAAGSHIGVARALDRGALHRPLARRISIVIGWLRLARTPSRRHGTSIYVEARRG